MIALTIWQPWASLIAEGLKPVENRDWKRDSLVGKRIAIHAGKVFDVDAAHGLMGRTGRVRSVVRDSQSVRGAIVATAVVSDFVTEFSNLTSVEMLAIRPWFTGPFGWILRDVRKFDPVTCRGAQGLWTVTVDVLARIPVEAR